MSSSLGFLTKEIHLTPQFGKHHSNGHKDFAILSQYVMNQALKFGPLAVFGLVQMMADQGFCSSLTICSESSSKILSTGPFCPCTNDSRFGSSIWIPQKLEKIKFYGENLFFIYKYLKIEEESMGEN